MSKSERDPKGYEITLTIHPDRFAHGASEIDAVATEIVNAVNEMGYVAGVQVIAERDPASAPARQVTEANDRERYLVLQDRILLGSYDDDLGLILRAVEERRKALDPTEELASLVATAREITDVIGQSVEKRAMKGTEVNYYLKKYLSHPSALVREYAKIIRYRIFIDLLEIPADKARTMDGGDNDDGTDQADAGQPTEG